MNKWAELQALLYGTILKCLTFVSQESQKEKRKSVVQKKKILEEIMAEDFANLVKDINVKDLRS